MSSRGIQGGIGNPSRNTPSAGANNWIARSDWTYEPEAGRPGRPGSQIVEAEAAVSAPQVVAIGTATETDGARPITATKVRALGTAIETDAAQPLGRVKVGQLGMATEVDSSRPFSRRKRRALGMATETDTAQPITRVAVSQTLALGMATETDAAQPIAATKVRALGTAFEADVAQLIGRRKVRALGICTEVDSSRPFSRRRRRALGICTELDEAQMIIRPVPRRVWAIQQVTSVANLNTYASQVADAKATAPALGGFGARIAWDLYTPAILPAGKAIADANGLPFSFRFMAGVHTPASMLDAMGAGYTALDVDGQRFPLPFGSDGTPGNPVFEDGFRVILTEVADWYKANGGSLLHCSQYARDWAELNHGLEVRNAPGYSLAAYLEGHRRLIDIAYDVAAAHPGLVVEFPLSGHGPLTNVSPVLADHMVTRFGAGTRRCVFQANGWGINGRWGAADPAVAAQMDACFARPVARALQAIQAWGGSGATFPQYTLAEVQSALSVASGCSPEYLELYLPTLRSVNGGAVWAQPLAEWLDGSVPAPDVFNPRARLGPSSTGGLVPNTHRAQLVDGGVAVLEPNRTRAHLEGGA